MNTQKASKTIFIVSLLLLFTNLNAQENFVPGMILKVDGTSASGKIDYQDYHSLSKRVSFMDGNGANTILLPQELKGYEIFDGPKFVSKEVDGLTYFLQILFEGRANLYTKRDVKGKNRFYIDKKDKPLQEILFSQEIVTAEKGNYLSSSKKHIGLLSLYMVDAPVTKETIKTISPNHKSLLKLFKQYHAEVCPDEVCYAFVDKTPVAVVHFEPVLSWINYQYSNKLSANNRSFIPGIYINIGLPRQIKTSHIRLGALLGSAKIVNEDGIAKTQEFFKFNAHLMYVSQKGIIRPKFSGGLDYIIPHQAGFGLMGGFNIHLNKMMAITTSYDFFAINFFSYEKQYYKPHHLNIGFQMLMK